MDQPAKYRILGYTSRIIGSLILDALFSRSELVIVAELPDHVRLSSLWGFREQNLTSTEQIFTAFTDCTSSAPGGILGLRNRRVKEKLIGNSGY